MNLFRFYLLPLSMCVAASADTAPVVLDPVEVNASSGSSTAPSLKAARAELALTPGGVETIDVERYLTGRASTLADTFFLSPGVFAQSRFGSDEARLSIRGSGLQRTFHGRGIRLLQDGVPLNLADGGFDMQSLEPTATAYLNVWRGGNALAYGGSTLGGAIDYVSRTGRLSPGAFARLEAGSWEYLRATIGGGVERGEADAFASFTQQSQEGFREHARQDNQRLFANAGVALSETVETRFYVTAVNTASELPGNLLKAELEADPRQANATNVAQDHRRDYELARIANKTAFRAAPDTTWTLLTAWTYKDLDHPIFQVIDQRTNDALAGASLDQAREVFGRDHRLRAGVLLQRGEIDAANYTNIGGSRGARLSADEQTATNLEAYAESQLALGAGFTGVLGASAVSSRREADRVFGAVTPANTYNRVYDHVAPKAGVRWDNAARDTQVFANVSGSHEPPSFSESGTPVVANDAQTATTFEVGTRGERGFVRWDVAAYHARIHDELLAIALPGGASGTLNADRTVHRGVELGVEADLLGQAWKKAVEHRVVLRAAWTYGDFRFDGPVPGVAGSNDNRIAGVPPHLVRGELLFETRTGWYFGPTFEWVPVESYVDHANTLSADPYALVGLKAGRRVSAGLSWFVEGRNLTDETYAATTGVVMDASLVPAFGDPLANRRQFLPGDGRAVYGGIEYKF